jgi:hypothetical protein
MKNQQQVTGLRPSLSISPGQALWNQRQAIAALRDRFETLRAAIGSPSDLNLYQWAEIAAFALEDLASDPIRPSLAPVARSFFRTLMPGSSSRKQDIG